MRTACRINVGERYRSPSAVACAGLFGSDFTKCHGVTALQEAKLKQWQNPKRPDSTLDNFAAASGYAGFAADAMARVRARLAGFEDDDTAMQQQQQGPLGAASAGGGQGTASTSPQQQQGEERCWCIDPC